MAIYTFFMKPSSLPKTSSRVEILAFREIISHSAQSSGSSLFRWFASHLWSSSPLSFCSSGACSCPGQRSLQRISRCVSNWPSSTGSSPAATASARSLLLGDSLATLEEVAGGLDHRQTRDRHQMAQARLQALLAMEVQGSGRPSEDRQGDS